MQHFLDYIINLEAKGEFLVKRAEDLPKYIDYLKENHKFATAQKMSEWDEELKACIAAEFDDSCMPVDWSKVAEPVSMLDTFKYIEEQSDKVKGYRWVSADNGRDWVGGEYPEEPPEWWSHVRPDTKCGTCGYLGGSPEHFFMCEEHY